MASAKSPKFPLRLLPTRLAVCKLSPDAKIPAWVSNPQSSLWSVTRTPEELSIVCPEGDIPANVADVERGFRAFHLVGPVPFATTGVVSGLTAPLAAAGLSVFVLSTFDTDYLLVKDTTLGKATETLRTAGFEVR